MIKNSNFEWTEKRGSLHGQQKPAPSIDKTAILKPPAPKPKK